MDISIIIPCYNVADCVQDAIESAVKQTYDKIEIICVDNNSQDNTWQILNSLVPQYKNLRIAKEMKAGGNSARNKGINLARGEWIQFLDADDLLEPGKIEHQVQLIKNSKRDVAFVAGACKKVGLDGNVRIENRISDQTFLAPFISQCGNTCANLWSQDWLRRIGLWNEDIKSSQETDLMLRLILAGGSFLIDEQPLTIIRERVSGQISKSDPIARWKRYIEIRLNYIDNLKECNVQQYKQLSPQFYDFLMVTLFTLGKHDRNAAIKIFEEKIKPNWTSGYHFGITKSKVQFVNMFGLKTYFSLSILLKKG